MIELIHKYPILIKTLLAITTLAFVATGGFLYMGNDSGGGWVAKVDDVTISYDEYQNTVARYVSFYNDLYQGELPQSLRDRIDRTAMDELVDRAVILLEMEDMGITVGDRQVSETIVQTPTFHDEAKTFDKQRYLEILKMNGISPKTYEDGVRRELTVSLFRDMVNEAAEATEEEARAFYAEQLAAMGEPFDEEKFQENKEQLIGQVKAGKEQAVMASVMNDIKSRHTIETNNMYVRTPEPPAPGPAPVQGGQQAPEAQG